MKPSAYLSSLWETARLDPLATRPGPLFEISDPTFGFSRIPVKNTFRLLRFFNKNLTRLNTLISRSELKNVLASSIEVLPEEAKYRSGDTIHGLAGGSIHRKLKVYGANTGGFSVVYTVLDDDTLEPYCLKAPRGPLADDSDVDRIAREARTWITLGRHPNIVYAHSLLEINGCINILLEYISGQTLSSRMKQSRLSIREALNYAIQLCRGIQFAQRKVPGLVHGDIKPGNCLLTADGVLKLTDFGQVGSFISPECDPSRDQVKEKSDALPKHWAAGTPAYMAPEQFDASNNTDVRSDIYSFGVTLFEMLTGQKPFRGDEHEECFQQHQNILPAEPRAINPDVSVRLSDLVVKCLSKSPSARPQDFSVVEAELSTIFLEDFQDAVPPVAPQALTENDLINRGASLIVLEQYEEALACLDHVLRLDPRSTLALTLRGKALALMGSSDEALACFKRAADSDPSWPFAWSDASEVFAQLGDYELALRCSDRAIELQKISPSFWSDRGNIFALKNKFESALQCLQRAVALDSHSALAHLRLGNLHFEQGQLGDAVERFKQVVTLNPLCPEARRNLATAYSRLGLTYETIEVCREALGLWPGSTEFLSLLQVAYRSLYKNRKHFSQNEETSSPVDFLVESHERDFVLSRCLSLLSTCDYDPLVFYLCVVELHHSAKSLGSSQKKELLEALEKVGGELSKNGADRKTFYWLGRLYYRLGNYDECMETFRQSSERFGPDDNAFYYLATCHELNGNFEEALCNYEEALSLDPQCRLIRYGLRRVEARIAAATEMQPDPAEFAYQT